MSKYSSVMASEGRAAAVGNKGIQLVALRMDAIGAKHRYLQEIIRNDVAMKLPDVPTMIAETPDQNCKNQWSLSQRVDVGLILPGMNKLLQHDRFSPVSGCCKVRVDEKDF